MRMRSWTVRMAAAGLVVALCVLAGGASAAGESAPRGGDAKVAAVVNVNTASEAELERLPGVGPAKARAIIEHRKKSGGFHTVDDLVAVPGIGEKALARLRPHVTVGEKSTARPKP